MPRVVLIEGTEEEDRKIWPPDWPCQLCARPFSKHISPFLVGVRKPWCFIDKDPEFKQAAYQWFKPIDNLTYVEHLAKDRKVPND